MFNRGLHAMCLFNKSTVFNSSMCIQPVSIQYSTQENLTHIFNITSSNSCNIFQHVAIVHIPTYSKKIQPIQKLFSNSPALESGFSAASKGLGGLAFTTWRCSW